MSEVKEIVVAVTNFLEKAMSAWEVFISTRQEAYNRAQDKRKNRAINCAEDIIFRIRSLQIEDKELDKLIRIFFKYNN